MDDQLDDQPPAPNVHQLPMSFNGMCVLQMKVMAKLNAMIGDLSEKIDLLTTATTCPQKSPLNHTTNNYMIPVLWLLSCTSLSPQQHTILGLLKPQGASETLHDSIL